jgi:hypothetical protein
MRATCRVRRGRGGGRRRDTYTRAATASSGGREMPIPVGGGLFRQPSDGLRTGAGASSCTPTSVARMCLFARPVASWMDVDGSHGQIHVPLESNFRPQTCIFALHGRIHHPLEML